MWFEEKKLATAPCFPLLHTPQWLSASSETPAKQDGTAARPEMGASRAGISPTAQHPNVSIIMKALLHHIKRKVKLHKGTSRNSSR